MRIDLYKNFPSLNFTCFFRSVLLLSVLTTSSKKSSEDIEFYSFLRISIRVLMNESYSVLISNIIKI
jgi:hypothetical protein